MHGIENEILQNFIENKQKVSAFMKKGREAGIKIWVALLALFLYIQYIHIYTIYIYIYALYTKIQRTTLETKLSYLAALRSSNPCHKDMQQLHHRSNMDEHIVCSITSEPSQSKQLEGVCQRLEELHFCEVYLSDIQQHWKDEMRLLLL